MMEEQPVARKGAAQQENGGDEKNVQALLHRTFELARTR